MSGTEPRTISWHALQSADVAARLDVVPGKGLDEPEVASSSGLYPGNEGRQGDGSSISMVTTEATVLRSGSRKRLPCIGGKVEKRRILNPAIEE